MVSKMLWLAASAIFVILGTLHLCYTFYTTKFHPRNKSVIDEMTNTSPRITNETTMWKTWIGFNASHSAGAIFFGLINNLLAVTYFSIIESSFILSLLTIVTSLFYLWLAKKYWFSVPFVAILIATICFVASPVFSFFN